MLDPTTNLDIGVDEHTLSNDSEDVLKDLADDTMIDLYGLWCVITF